ncbi:calmodulin-like [Pecten maximus]|uniref:calmodulin-like n=1 Tax=Pecten maximus TaxID=6579 RepID=UPI001457F53C|nr:calmodulin-like [Pecten maximus]
MDTVINMVDYKIIYVVFDVCFDLPRITDYLTYIPLHYTCYTIFLIWNLQICSCKFCYFHNVFFLQDVTSSLTEVQIAELKEVFSFYDKNCDGFVDLGDLGPMMRSMGLNPSEKEILAYTEQFNQRHDKNVDFRDALEVVVDMLSCPLETEESLREAFRVLDRDGSGYVSCAELTQMMTSKGERLSDDDVKEMMLEADDGEGHIKYEEFVRLILGKELRYVSGACRGDFKMELNTISNNNVMMDRE